MLSREEYAEHCYAAQNSSNLLDPGWELMLLHDNTEEWALTLRALITGHVRKNRPYLTADYVLGKLADPRLGRNCLDDFNGAIYDEIAEVV
jgi:hypothetical protein